MFLKKNLVIGKLIKGKKRKKIKKKAKRKETKRNKNKAKKNEKRKAKYWCIIRLDKTHSMDWDYYISFGQDIYAFRT